MVNSQPIKRLPSLPPGHYRATVTCPNCETPNSLVILKGVTVADFIAPRHNAGKPYPEFPTCLYCGCELAEEAIA